MTLTLEQKAFIVTRLAMFDTPQTVADAVQELFGTTVSRQRVQAYDPKREKVGGQWRTLFDSTRERFLEQRGK